MERACGLLAVVVTLGGVLGATTIDPTFSWSTDALSDLGTRAGSAPVFNASVILGGALGVVYANGLRRQATTPLAHCTGFTFGLAMLGLMGVGLFPLGHPMHVPTAAGFFGLFTVAMLCDGIRRRDETTGKTTLGLVGLHLLVWATWILGLWPVPGLALPEIVGAALLVAWLVVSGSTPPIPWRRKQPNRNFH